jgi:uncharacterized membrane protein
VDSAISFLVPCAIVAAASVPLMLKVVPPNRAYGLRMQRTLADPDLWYRANRFAGCAFFIASAVSVAIFLSRPELASGRSLAGLAVFAVPLVVAMIASVAYVRRSTRRDAAGRDA